MINISEHEIRRHAKNFVDAYLNDGPEAAGKYGVSNIMDPETMSEEELAFWQKEIAAEFDRHGYTMESDDNENSMEAS